MSRISVAALNTIAPAVAPRARLDSIDLLRGRVMVVLAGLVYLPLSAIATIGVAIILFYNTLDGVRVTGWRPDAPALPATSILWIVLHQGGSQFHLFGSWGPTVVVLYPLIPWIGAAVVGVLFVLCRWYAGVKRRSRLPLLRYL